MAERIDLPTMPAGSAEQQMQQMYSYLYRLATAMNHNMSEIGSMDLTDSERQVMQTIIAEETTGDINNTEWQEKESLKSLIIKTAAFVKNELDAYRLNLLGEYVTEGKFGRYVRNTGLKVDVTPEGIQQDFTFEEVVQGLKSYSINAKNYIKTGLLRTVNGVPVYGVAIGKDVVTFSQDGTETYNDGNKVAELTADELSFWQGGNKVASYTGSKISFLSGGYEVMYIQNGQINVSGDFKITSSGSFDVDTANFKISSEDKKVTAGPWQFSNSGARYYVYSMIPFVITTLEQVPEQSGGIYCKVGGSDLDVFMYLDEGGASKRIAVGLTAEYSRQQQAFSVAHFSPSEDNVLDLGMATKRFRSTNAVIGFFEVVNADTFYGQLLGNIGYRTAGTTNANNITSAGLYWLNASGMTGLPSGLTGRFELEVNSKSDSSGDYVVQKIYTESSMYSRRKTGATWGSWYKYTGTAV